MATPKAKTLNTNITFGKDSDFYGIHTGGVDWNSVPYTSSTIPSSKWNAGQTFALASGALGTMAGYTQSRYQAKALLAQADAYEAQRGLNYSAYRRNERYAGEEYLSQAENLVEQGKQLFGQQMAMLGGSGMDVSAGDQRILLDDAHKLDLDLFTLNRSAYLQSVESWTQTMIEDTRLIAAAKTARNEAKFVKKMAKWNLASGILSTAANVYSKGYGPKLKTKEA